MNQKAPHLNGKNTDFINWFSEHNITPSDETMELHLYQLILIHRLFYMHFSMDQTCSNYGHIILIYPLLPQLHESHNNHLGIVTIKVLQRDIRFKVEHANGLCEQTFSATGTHT
jgi:hypothetical protein